MIVKVHFFSEPVGGYVGILQCEECLALLDNVTAKEISGLSTGFFGRVLCIHCEERQCPSCLYVYKRQSDLDIIKSEGVCWFCLGKEKRNQHPLLSSTSNLDAGHSGNGKTNEKLRRRTIN